MTTAAELDRLGIDPAAVEAALDADRTFPARWYSDPAIYDFELDSIFTRSWVIAGPLDRLAKAGDHLVCRAGHVPILVTRARDGQLRGFVNVCRHRAYPVATEDGCRQLLQCAYHAWTYELDGRLNRAPRAEAEPGFDKADFSLVPVSVDTWGPLVWVNPDPNAPPLREAYPGFEELAAAHGMDFSGLRLPLPVVVLGPGELEGLGRERQRVLPLPDHPRHVVRRRLGRRPRHLRVRQPGPAPRPVHRAEREGARVPEGHRRVPLHLRLAVELHRHGRVRRLPRHHHADRPADVRLALPLLRPRGARPGVRGRAGSACTTAPSPRMPRRCACSSPACAQDGAEWPADAGLESAISRFHRMVWESFKESLGIEA